MEINFSDSPEENAINLDGVFDFTFSQGEYAQKTPKDIPNPEPFKYDELPKDHQGLIDLRSLSPEQRDHLDEYGHDFLETEEGYEASNYDVFDHNGRLLTGDERQQFIDEDKRLAEVDRQLGLIEASRWDIPEYEDPRDNTGGPQDV